MLLLIYSDVCKMYIRTSESGHFQHFVSDCSPGEPEFQVWRAALSNDEKPFGHGHYCRSAIMGQSFIHLPTTVSQ